jgi:hypothetical protein
MASKTAKDFLKKSYLEQANRQLGKKTLVPYLEFLDMPEGIRKQYLQTIVNKFKIIDIVNIIHTNWGSNCTLSQFEKYCKDSKVAFRFPENLKEPETEKILYTTVEGNRRVDKMETKEYIKGSMRQFTPRAATTLEQFCKMSEEEQKSYILDIEEQNNHVGARCAVMVGVKNGVPYDAIRNYFGIRNPTGADTKQSELSKQLEDCSIPFAERQKILMKVWKESDYNAKITAEKLACKESIVGLIFQRMLIKRTYDKKSGEHGVYPSNLQDYLNGLLERQGKKKVKSAVQIQKPSAEKKPKNQLRAYQPNDINQIYNLVETCLKLYIGEMEVSNTVSMTIPLENGFIKRLRKLNKTAEKFGYMTESNVFYSLSKIGKSYSKIRQLGYVLLVGDKNIGVVTRTQFQSVFEEMLADGFTIVREGKAKVDVSEKHEETKSEEHPDPVTISLDGFEKTEEVSQPINVDNTVTNCLKTANLEFKITSNKQISECLSFVESILKSGANVTVSFENKPF